MGCSVSCSSSAFLTEAAKGFPGFTVSKKSGMEDLISGTDFPETRWEERKLLSFNEGG